MWNNKYSWFFTNNNFKMSDYKVLLRTIYEEILLQDNYKIECKNYNTPKECILITTYGTTYEIPKYLNNGSKNIFYN